MSCPAPTTGSTASSRVATRCPTRASSASAWAWWPPRSWPTPPTRCATPTWPSSTGATWSACQLFSEPGAGSDLAGLQTRADRDGDEWILNGQKVWTSGAQYSDIGEIICRTDPDMPKHKGLTGFVVDMHAPGVEVRPLRQMTGGASFNEVFFTDVRVPDSHRLGDVNQGWTVALTTLMNERASIGAGGGGGTGLGNVVRLAEMVRHFGLADDPITRQELMKVYIGFQVSKYTNQRALDKIKAGQLPGPEMSIAKLSLTNNMWRSANFVASVLGPRVQADTGEWGTFAWSQFLCGVPGMQVAGGTDEVMKNIVGERVLGLPKDPGIDATTAVPRPQGGHAGRLTAASAAGRAATSPTIGVSSRHTGDVDISHRRDRPRAATMPVWTSTIDPVRSTPPDLSGRPTQARAARRSRWDVVLALVCVALLVGAGVAVAGARTASSQAGADRTPGRAARSPAGLGHRQDEPGRPSRPD